VTCFCLKHDWCYLRTTNRRKDTAEYTKPSASLVACALVLSRARPSSNPLRGGNSLEGRTKQVIIHSSNSLESLILSNQRKSKGGTIPPLVNEYTKGNHLQKSHRRSIVHSCSNLITPNLLQHKTYRNRHTSILWRGPVSHFGFFLQFPIMENLVTAAYV
jgi:hypothetical protein